MTHVTISFHSNFNFNDGHNKGDMYSIVKMLKRYNLVAECLMNRIISLITMPEGVRTWNRPYHVT